MATFRAVENGVVIVRQEDQGISMAVDAYGRTMATADHFAGKRTLWVEAPIASSVSTIYPFIGDAAGHLAILGFVIMAAWVLIAGRKAKRQATSQQAPLRPAYERRSRKVD